MSDEAGAPMQRDRVEEKPVHSYEEWVRRIEQRLLENALAGKLALVEGKKIFEKAFPAEQWLNNGEAGVE